MRRSNLPSNTVAVAKIVNDAIAPVLAASRFSAAFATFAFLVSLVALGFAVMK